MMPRFTFIAVIGLAAAVCGDASAQQVTGTLGSPSATTTINGAQLPTPAPEFGGVIKDNALQSTPWWAPRIVPPSQAPNVLLIMTDDSGYGVPSTFGGVIPTPALDRVAADGLRYTQMHSTALCSPTRAALITGRNHHSTGFSVISEQSTGFPGYNSIIGRNMATIGRILKDNGYATSWFGKNHNVPAFQASQAGPFDLWPIGMGFEYFYGFIGGDANQWQPNLFRNTTQIYPFEGKPGWNLTTGMADDAIDYLNRMNQIQPSKPFFLYYVPGGTHAPHHPTQEWVDKIQAMHLFDDGYEKLRERIFANQKKLGVIPQDAQMSPWPSDILKPWDQTTDDEKKLFIRQVEVFAAYAAYTDHEIGRVIQAVEDMGKLDNTLIIYINGDNGTSAEGGPLGTPNEVAFFNGLNMLPVDVQMKFYDVWGTDKTYNHMSAAWSWAFDTPFSWFKQIASHLGGVRQGMAVSWPGHITANPDPLNNVEWELFDLTTDYSQVTDVAAQYPDKVAALKQVFHEEAKKYNVLPLDASVAARIVAPRPNITAGRSEFVYTKPMVGLPQGDSPLLLNTSYTVTAEIEVPEGGAEGMILASGGRFGGYGFYLLQGKPVWTWNMVDLQRIKWQGPDVLTPGKHTLVFDFKYDGLGPGTLAFNDFSGVGRPGTGTLSVDGKVVATQTMEKTLPMTLQWDESFDIGSDTLTGVDDADYQTPFPLTAKLDKLTVKLDRPVLSDADKQKLKDAMLKKD